MSIGSVQKYQSQGQLDKALRELEGLNDPLAILLKAEILGFIGYLTKANELLDDLISSRNVETGIKSRAELYKANLSLSQSTIDEIKDKINKLKIINDFDKTDYEATWTGLITQLEGDMHKKEFKFKSALDSYKTSLKSFEKSKNQREYANTIHSIGIMFEHQGKLDDALIKYKESFELRKKLENKYDIAISLNRIGVIYGKKSNFDLALKNLEQAVKSATDVGFKFELAKIFVNLGIINKLNGDLVKAENYYKEALDISLELNDIENIVKAHINIGNIQLTAGNLFEATNSYDMALPLSNKIGNQKDVALLYNNLGIVHKRRGQFNQALKFYQHSLELQLEMGDDKLIAPALHNIGVVFLLQGELNQALDNFEKSLQIWENLGNFIEIANNLQFIGLIYLERGDHEKSLNYLMKCLDLRKKVNNLVSISETLYHLVVAFSHNGDQKAALKYYNELAKIDKKLDNKEVHTRKRLTQAIILQKDTRINKIVEAQELFEEVLSEDLIDNELTIFAMLKLCEFLLLELKVSGEKEVLVEIKTLLEKLYEMAQEQESHTLLIEILIIQSQLALADYNIKETKEFLQHANEIAEDKELAQYKLKISYLLDRVEKDVLKYANIASTIPINERIDQLAIEGYLKEVADHKDLNSFNPEMFKTGLKKNLQMHLNFANLLLLDKTLPEEMKKYVHFIELSAKEIQFSISTLLMIEKLEAGTYYQNLEDFNLDEIIQLRINHYEEKLNEKSLVVDFQQTNGITAVRSDQYLFSRIMDHLLDNAIKFAEERSTIKIILETDENSRTLMIENECEAIPEHEQSNLFDKYTQYLVHESTRKHGVGLGLAFCNHAIKSIKGEIKLVSPLQNKANGVSVTIKVPKEI